MKEIGLAIDGAFAVCAWRAANPVERARGLLGRPAPPPGRCLLIEPCGGIHTCGMRYAIDAVFLDRAGRVLRICERLPPWRFARCRAAAAVLEFAAGEAACLGLRTGCHVARRA